MKRRREAGWWTAGVLAVVTMGSLLIGCAVSNTYIPPTPIDSTEPYVVTVDKSFDETWTALIDHVSGSFFAVETYEKASGFITLSFGVSKPEQFIDCGEIDYRSHNKAENFTGPYAAFWAMRHPRVRLSGAMNIRVKSLAEEKTLVRVNARYIFDRWTFDSGTEDTQIFTMKITGKDWSTGQTLPPIAEKRTCRPTYVAEQMILTAVSTPE